MPTMSVVMPLYNTERYVEQAIASVLAQTFKDFELIVVDDGSTDESVQRVRRLRDPRIRLISQVNRGLAGARNTGIRHAQGRYIAFLDADDAWRSDKLRLHARHLDNAPRVGVSYCQSAFMDDDSLPLGLLQSPKLVNVGAMDILCRNPVGNGSAPVIRKAALDAIRYETIRRDSEQDCWFDESLRQSEDIECWLRIATQTAWEFEGIGQPLTWYRVNAGGLSANLEKQFQSWLTVRDKAAVYAPALIKKYGLRAEAYQLRYLARRAVKSRDAVQALRLSVQSLRRDWRILLAEPKRTLTTFGCALLLRLLPVRHYESLEKCFLALSSQWRGHQAYSPLMGG